MAGVRELKSPGCGHQGGKKLYSSFSYSECTRIGIGIRYGCVTLHIVC